ERRGLSVRQLAELAGVGFATVHPIEGGRLSPTVARLEKLAEALDVHITHLFPPQKRKPARRKRIEGHSSPESGRDPKPKRTGRKVRGVFFRDGEWWIRWACSLGHDHRKPSGELKTAAGEEHKAKRAEVREARKTGQECCPRLARPERPLAFDDMLADYLVYSEQSKRSHRHDRTRGKRLRAVFGGRLASDITSKDVEAFKADFARDRSVATVNHYLRLLKAVFNRAVRQGRISVNPVRAVPLYR